MVVQQVGVNCPSKVYGVAAGERGRFEFVGVGDGHVTTMECKTGAAVEAQEQTQEDP